MTQNLKIEVLTGDISIDGMVVTNLVTKEELSQVATKKADLGADGKIPTNQLPDNILNATTIVDQVKTQLETSIKDAVDESNAYAESYTDNAVSSKADLVTGKVPLEQLPAIDQYPQFGTALSNLSTSILTSVKQRTDELEKTKADLGEDGKVLREQIPSYEKISGLPEQLEVMSTQTAAVSGELDQHKLQTADQIDVLKENIEANVQQLTDRQSHLMRTYATKELGVDANVGVKPGEYFYVRSTNEEEMMVEYQNVGGVATATGESYLSAIGVQQQEKQASTIKDDSGLSQQEVNDYQGRLNTILNKTGTTETLAESVDATPFLQALISAMPDGMTLDLLGKTFRVKKNTGFSSDYPNGDQPCLVIKRKKNIKITNGKLLVKEHAQGCIDCIDSNGVINGLIIEGAGNFPPLYGTTGRGEKGEAIAGYFNEALYNSGQPRNNSVDTSGYSGGNYGSNGFPQWGGGNAATWGVWNGGYIFNVGDGIYLKNSDFKVEACDIYGFNGGPVCIVEGSVTLERNKLHDCYTAGFLAKSYGDGAGKVINSVEISNNHIYNIGHPDSKRTDTNVDPGYGVSTSNKGASTAGVRSYKVYGNYFYNCKRKAVDAHHSYFADVYGNRIETCGYGVFVTINNYGAAPKFTNVHDNFIRDIHMSVSTKGVGVDVTSLSTENGGFEGVININSNYLEDIGVPKSIFATHPSSATGFGITVNGIECANIGNNTIITTENCVTYVAIMDGSTGTFVNPRSIISGNYIRGKMQYGIFARKDQWVASHAKLHNAGIVSGNLVDVRVRDDQTTAIGINSYIYCKVHGNTVAQNAGVTPYVNNGVVPSGVYEFDVDLVTRVVSNISQPAESNLVLSDINVSAYGNTTLQITLPSLYKISGIYTNEKSIPRTATNYGLFYNSGGSYSNLIRLAFTNNTGVGVNLSEITSGIIRVFVTVPEIRLGG